MQITATDGSAPANQHHFSMGAKQIALTIEEMKVIADYYWEHHGKNSMKDFYEKYQHNAAENIREALGMHEPPEEEKDIKNCIAMALIDGNADLFAEVVFEAMEWETAYAALKNID